MDSHAQMQCGFLDKVSTLEMLPMADATVHVGTAGKEGLYSGKVPVEDRPLQRGTVPSVPR